MLRALAPTKRPRPLPSIRTQPKRWVASEPSTLAWVFRQFCSCQAALILPSTATPCSRPRPRPRPCHRMPGSGGPAPSVALAAPIVASRRTRSPYSACLIPVFADIDFSRWCVLRLHPLHFLRRCARNVIKEGRTLIVSFLRRLRRSSGLNIA